jgi:endonuclease/exonuclease/phosphatase family metal-dependent hydrolase
MSGALRVASYNIHACRGIDGRQDLERVADVLRELDADVVGLQEVESRRRRSAIDQAEALAERLGMHCIEGPLLLEGRGWYGNALLSRWPAQHTRRMKFEIYRREARGAVISDLAPDGQPTWRIANTHLDLRSGLRRRQFATLLRELTMERTTPTVLLGDFNEWWRYSRGLATLRRHMHLPPTPPTFPSWLPVLRLDRIAFLGCHPVGPVRRHWTPLSRRASDHLPVWAEVAPIASHRAPHHPGRVSEEAAADRPR